MKLTDKKIDGFIFEETSETRQRLAELEESVIIPEAIYWSKIRRFLNSYAAHRTWEVGQNNDDLKILEWLFEN